MTIDRVVAQVGLPADEPARERRMAVVADLVERPLPVDQRGLLAPEAVAVGDRASVELSVAGHHHLRVSRN